MSMIPRYRWIRPTVACIPGGGGGGLARMGLREWGWPEGANCKCGGGSTYTKFQGPSSVLHMIQLYSIHTQEAH